MSEKYPGGLITKTPVTPAGPYQTGAASGVWTLDQQLQYQKQGIWPTAGLTPNYIEDVFSTWLYTGNGSTQSIVNGINLSANGGLVWCKMRSPYSGYDHVLVDTARGVNNFIDSNNTTAQRTTASISAFNANGFTLDGAGGYVNINTANEVSWTFRKQAKFFDVVTYTGTGSVQDIAHNLGSVPGCIIIKNTNSGSYGWTTYHQSVGNTSYLSLNATDEAFVASNKWNNTTPTSSVFTVGTGADVNRSGYSYVAYIFASDAGGFGAAGTDNVITCGGFTLTGGTDIINLGYEPQWFLVKRVSSALNWQLIDIMRGMTVSNSAAYLYPNLANAEVNGGSGFVPTATGISIRAGSTGSPGDVFIYIAIRRGPMKTPTDATKVFSPIARTGTGAAATVTTTNLPDSIWSMNRPGSTGYPAFFYDRLRGANTFLIDNTGSETTDNANSSRYSVTDFNNLSYGLGIDGNYAGINGLTSGYSNWVFSRAPGFFDEVCYTGTGSATTQAHNLGVAPELIIVKGRSIGGYSWFVYDATSGNTKASLLNTTGIPTAYSPPAWNNTSPTSTVFSVGTGSGVNSSGDTYVAYLFATCAGVSKVGSYTGNGTTQTINCGFTGGARFVLIKRTDTTGDWYVYDTARGMTILTDPYLLLNSSAAESATLGSVTTVSTGFALNSTILAAINVSGGTYIFLAIA